MSASSISKYFDIPKFYYFESNNDFTGSRDQVFNYKIMHGDPLKIQIWHGLICSDKAEIEQEKEFPSNQSGFEDMIHWLDDQYEIDLKNRIK